MKVDPDIEENFFNPESRNKLKYSKSKKAQACCTWTSTKPVIVIDEANALQLWESKDSVALKQFLEFLKRSCKQYHTAHVILASSEFFMISWLQKQGYDANSRDDQVLGDLTSAEAFVYLCGGKVLNSAIAGRKAWLKRCQSLKWRSLKV
ncbi:hypothetical protein Ndes2526A_g00552 [Nannochloris sp. 'desiccata']